MNNLTLIKELYVLFTDSRFIKTFDLERMKINNWLVPKYNDIIISKYINPENFNLTIAIIIKMNVCKLMYIFDNDLIDIIIIYGNSTWRISVSEMGEYLSQDDTITILINSEYRNFLLSESNSNFDDIKEKIFDTICTNNAN